LYFYYECIANVNEETQHSFFVQESIKTSLDCISLLSFAVLVYKLCMNSVNKEESVVYSPRNSKNSSMISSLASSKSRTVSETLSIAPQSPNFNNEADRFFNRAIVSNLMK